MSVRISSFGFVVGIVCSGTLVTAVGWSQTLSATPVVEVTVAAPVSTNETTVPPASVALSNAGIVGPVSEAVATPNKNSVSDVSSEPKPITEQASPETAPVQKAQESPCVWSLGAGVGWTAYSTGLASLSTSMPLGSMGTVGTGASAITFLERRLTKTIYALVQPEFSYFRGKGPNEEHTSYARAFTLSAGARWVLNPDALVEVGMAHVLQISSSSAGDESAEMWSTLKSSGLGVSTALVVERKLLSQLWLRIAANLLSANWAKTTQHLENSAGSVGGDGVTRSLTVRLAINPSLSLRLEF